MNMNRLRPPKDCKDLDLWLSGVINDAMRDAVEAGLEVCSAAGIAETLAESWGRQDSRLEAERLQERAMLIEAAEYIEASNAEINVVTRIRRLRRTWQELVEGLRKRAERLR